MVNNPKIILADEPTGNLDSTTASEVYNLYEELKGLHHLSISHDYAAFAHRFDNMFVVHLIHTMYALSIEF